MRSKYEIKCQKELEKEGWVVDYKCRPFRVPRGYSVDYFGLFDIMAYRPGELRWIAIKGHSGIPKKLRVGVENFVLPKGCVKELWTFRLDKTVRKEIIS